MRTVNIYKFDELTNEAQARAINNCRANAYESFAYMFEDDYNLTLERIEGVFGIKVLGLEYGPSWTWREERWAEVDGMKGGAMLVRYLNEIDRAIDTRKRYWGPNGKKRISKVMHERNWCLTGTYTDDAVDRALNNRADAVKQGKSIKDFVYAMLRDYRREWENELLDSREDDNVREYIEANEFEFTADGQLFN